MKKFITGLIMGLVFATPAVAVAQRVFDPTMNVGTGHDVQRFDDPQYQIKCWLYDIYNGGGISCLPWDEVKER